jgi:hypothetical protein
MVICWLVVNLACTSPVQAYDQAGHFYSTYSALTSDVGTEPERALVAFCTQLPDLAADLDAVAVYKRAILESPLKWYRWAQHDDVGRDPAIHNMIAIQQLLHALTGGDASAIQQVAEGNLQNMLSKTKSAPDRAAALCALGFGLHFYGDALAHRQLDKSNRMYETGFGHGNDLHYPDYAFCDAPQSPSGLDQPNHCLNYASPERQSSRTGAWKWLWSREHALREPPPPRTAAPLDTATVKWEAVQKLSQKAGDFGDWQENALRTALVGKTGLNNSYPDFFEKEKSTDRSCESVLATALAKLPGLSIFTGLRCSAVWALYAPSIQLALGGRPTSTMLHNKIKDFSAAYASPPLTNEPGSVK